MIHLMMLLFFFAGHEQQEAWKSSPVDTQKVSFVSSDGLLLHGQFIRSAHSAPGLLLIHMCNVGQRKDYESLASQLASCGFNLLAFDFRGHGESRKDLLDVVKDKDRFWENERGMIMEDIASAYDFLLSRPGVDAKRIGIVAASCGVGRAVKLASKSPGIRALVLLSGGAESAGLHYLRMAKDLPILGLAAEDDGDGIAADWIREILHTSNNPERELVIFKTGGHGTDLLRTHAGLENRIATWLSSKLQK